MCKVYNQVGSLTTVKTHLHNQGILDFKSIKDLLSFNENYVATRQNIISNSSLQIAQEKEKLREEIVLLEDFIETCRTEYTSNLLAELEGLKYQLEAIRSNQSSLFDRINGFLKRNSIQSKIRSIETNFDLKIADSLRKHTDPLTQKKRRVEYIEHNFEKAIVENAFTQAQEIDRRKAVVNELMPHVYGAIGEQKVSKELELLPDDYILINDFTCSFRPPIYNKQEHDHIQSIQIDHILVAPSGVFLIETKNWSEASMKSLSLRSPVEQIKRTNFALYVTLNRDQDIMFDYHHWGDRKIPIKNLIVMINQKPKEEFQHVKVLTLNELRNYVEYFKPVFTRFETQTIGEYLLRLSGKNNY